MVYNPERGGPTTQSGIYFQNCVTALRLAQMLSRESVEQASSGRIVSVRVEAPEEVDDTVVTYESGSKEYIQSKTAISPGTETWKILWKHFYAQYKSDSFDKSERGDRMTLAVRATPLLNDLQNMLVRAGTSESEEEWRSRLTEPQRKLLDGIEAILEPAPGELLGLCRRVALWSLHFEDDPNGSNSFEKEVSRILDKTVAPLNGVFSILIDLTGRAARERRTLSYRDLSAQLEFRGVKILPKLSGWSGGISAEQTRLMTEVDELQKSLDFKNRSLERVRRKWEVETDILEHAKLERQLADLTEETKDLARQIDFLNEQITAKSEDP